MTEGFYARAILPRLIGCACASPAIMRQRAEVTPLAAGRVLELGAGCGHNLAFYAPAQVTRVVALEPSAALRARAAPPPAGLKVEWVEGVAEDLPFADRSFDAIVCTFTLCSVQDPAAVLAEARRVLAPGGAFLFSEHGLAPDPGVARWQRRLEPVWTRLAGGCRLTRPVAASIAAAGFRVEAQQRYLPRTPRPLGWCEWGRATA